jgi:serine/threonine protein kinase
LIRGRPATPISFSNNLQLLNNGTLKLPAQVLIGGQFYNVTRGFKLSPNYLGHPTNDPDTTVVIRTNHLYRLFDRPEVFMRQFHNTQNSGLLLDFDTRHSILVLLDVQSLRSNAKLLSRGVLKFQSYVMIGKGIFVVTGEMIRTRDYVQYVGYLRSDQVTQVVIKCYDDYRLFNRESFALDRLGRLLEKDDQNNIVVSNYVEGFTLETLLKNVYRHPNYFFKYLNSYIPAIKQFHSKWKFSHGNINASNIMIDPDGSIVLVNFEYCQAFWAPVFDKLRIEDDLKKANDALESHRKLVNAFRSPLELPSQRFLWKYISVMGPIHGHDIIKHLWEKIRKRQLDEFENSENNSRSGLNIAMAATYLANPLNIKLHFVVNVGINEYKLTEYISTGAQGSTYRGYFVQDPSEKIVLKIYKHASAFLAERFALVVTGRFRDDDPKNLITIQKEIPGVLLSKWYAEELQKSRPTLSKEELFKEITQLLIGFHSKWKLAHNDVRPQNIIRKPDGTLELIDFGFSKTLCIDDEERHRKLIQRDFGKARREFEFYLDGLAVKAALIKPSRAKLPIVKKYVDMLKNRGEIDKANYIWLQYHKSLSHFNTSI